MAPVASAQIVERQLFPPAVLPQLNLSARRGELSKAGYLVRFSPYLSDCTLEPPTIQ